jgi:hypothetical protein
LTLAYTGAGTGAIVTTPLAIPASGGAMTVSIVSTGSCGIARYFECSEIVDNNTGKRCVSGYFTYVFRQFCYIRPPASQCWLMNIGVYFSKGGKYPFNIDCLF